MLLTLVEQNKIATLTLPSRVSGRYSLGIVTVEGAVSYTHLDVYKRQSLHSVYRR